MSQASTTASTPVATPAPSTLTTLIAKTNTDPISALTTQVLHNLQHQHLWTSLKTHYPRNSQLSTSQQEQQGQADSVSSISPPVPLVSGIPPHRLYTHPDEQLYLLDIGLREEDLPPERIWVLPTTQGQSWSLQKLAAVFDALPATPSNPEQDDANSKNKNESKDKNSDGDEKEEKLAQYLARKQKADERKEWGGKRILFAMVDRLVGGDGTVVYYVIHDGHVKPRQN